MPTPVTEQIIMLLAAELALSAPQIRKALGLGTGVLFWDAIDTGIARGWIGIRDSEDGGIYHLIHTPEESFEGL